MSTVIETGKTVEEALEKALVALGRSVDEVDYEVIEQPSRGFFGLFGGRMARLRVTEKQEDVTPAAPAAAAAAPAGAQSAAFASTAPAAGTPRARGAVPARYLPLHGAHGGALGAGDGRGLCL